MVIFPNAKINLGLHVTAKRADGYHELQTVYYPIPIYDVLEAVQSSPQLHEEWFTISGIPIPSGPNICLKAYNLLKKDFPGLPAVKMHLHKAVPAGSGLGSGSADGAHAILLLNRKFKLGLDNKRMMNYALELGSDCPFFILNKPCLASGRGEILEEIQVDLTGYTIVLVNAGIHVDTPTAFSMIRPSRPEKNIREIIAQPPPAWKGQLKNDFEEPVFALHPELREIREKMYNDGAVYAAMTGSGSTIFGLFAEPPRMDFPKKYFIRNFNSGR